MKTKKEINTIYDYLKCKSDERTFEEDTEQAVIVQTTMEYLMSDFAYLTQVNNYVC